MKFINKEGRVFDTITKPLDMYASSKKSVEIGVLCIVKSPSLGAESFILEIQSKPPH